MPQQQPPPATTSGPIHGVPCPHCGKLNDFREVREELDKGLAVSCDVCNRMIEVVGVQPVTVVRVRRHPAWGDRQAPKPRTPGQAHTISAGQAQAMVRRR